MPTIDMSSCPCCDIDTDCCPDDPSPLRFVLTVTGSTIADGEYIVSWLSSVTWDYSDSAAYGTCLPEGVRSVWQITCMSPSWQLSWVPSPTVAMIADFDCVTQTGSGTIDLSFCGGSATAAFSIAPE